MYKASTSFLDRCRRRLCRDRRYARSQHTNNTQNTQTHRQTGQRTFKKRPLYPVLYYTYDEAKATNHKAKKQQLPSINTNNTMLNL